MRIKNLTGYDLLCSIDQKRCLIKHTESVQIEEFETICFIHRQPSYEVWEAQDSNILKLFSILGDPFKLHKEYHIVVDCEISKNQLYDPQQLIITSHTEYVDHKTRTYYEYFAVKCDNTAIFPNHIYVAEEDSIKQKFEQNIKKLARWNAFWNFFIEPLVLEGIGYFLLYFLLYIWIGNHSWFVIISLIALNLIIEFVFFIFNSHSKCITKFCYYLDKCVIMEMCYKTKGRSLS